MIIVIKSKFCLSMQKQHQNKILTVLVFLIVLQSFPGTAPGQDSSKRPADKPRNDRETYYEASKQKILGNYDKAIDLYKKSLDQDPTDAAAMYELASIYSEQGNNSESAPLAEKAVVLDPSNKWYKILLVQLYQAQGKYEDAGGIIHQLIMAEPDNIEYYQDEALNYIYDNDYKNAVKSYDILEQKLGINEDISIQKEKIYIMMGKPDKAIEEIQKLSGAFPGEPRYLEMLAELY
jgi:tetratricopeptide (TPR) repeat protein